MRLLCAVLLILSGVSVFSTLSDVPAFDPTLRKATVLGGWRVAANAAMYDPGTYAFQRGYGFLVADGLVSADTEARDQVASIETAEKRAIAAIDALQEAVEADPGNAHAWSSMAWAKAQIGEDELALAALRNSWGLAPYNRALAATRVNLIGALTSPDFLILDLSEDDIGAIQRDFSVLDRYEPGTLRFYAEVSPHLTENFQLPPADVDLKKD